MTKSRFTAVAILLVIVLAGHQEASGQIKNRWNIKTSYSSYISPVRQGEDHLKMPTIRAEANYGILNFLDAGVYFGASLPKFSGNISFCPQYGITVNFQTLPLIFEGKNLRFDLYLTGKIGGVYFKTQFSDKNYSEYGLGIGLAYHIWKHIGVYGEYSFGKYHINDFGYDKKQRTSLRYGISIKF